MPIQSSLRTLTRLRSSSSSSFSLTHLRESFYYFGCNQKRLSSSLFYRSKKYSADHNNSFSFSSSSHLTPPPSFCISSQNNEKHHFYLTTSHCRHITTTNNNKKHTYKNDEIDKKVLYPPPTDKALEQHQKEGRGLPLLVRAAHFAQSNHTLLYDTYQQQQDEKEEGKKKKIAYTYDDILQLSAQIHNFILSNTSIKATTTKNQNADKINAKKQRKIAFLCNPSSSYVAVQWSCWSTGSIAVPLCVSHTKSELKYVIEDCDAEFIISAMEEEECVEKELRKALEELGFMDRLVRYNDIIDTHTKQQQQRQPNNQEQQPHYELGSDTTLIPSLDTPAMILYTSGTTGNPKGVVSTHRNIYHQITDLVLAWKWNKDDSILHFLPLHHVHGVINKLCCAIWVGASVEFIKFNPIKLWKRLADQKKYSKERRAITLFMAVPTVYAKLLETIPSLPPDTLSNALSSTLHPSNMRLMVSGSAALPTSILSKWEDVTSHRILERYGMTEFAMALSNPYDVVGERYPGYVGLPLPSVKVKIVDEDTGDVIPNATISKTASGTNIDETATNSTTTAELSGELCVKGPTVFTEYYNKPHATASSFDFDGYFHTGDVAEYDPKYNAYHILGRVSADIIKCGGHKLSSLHIERVLLEHPLLEEAVVLGVPDETYGEVVALICRIKKSKNDDGVQETLTLEGLKEWCIPRMAKYKIPTVLRVMEDDIPKNAMGKVSKKQLVFLFTEEK